MANKQATKSGMGRKLLLLFFLAAAVRAVLSMLFRDGPLVIIDEGLYTNIARGIAFEGHVSFRGQPVSYPYLLYPLLLAPVYRLNALIGGPVYRYVQAFNALLFSASVFPVYALGKAFTGKEKSGFAAAVLTVLMPDGILAAFTMSESLLWPLILATVYYSFRFLTDGDRRSAGLAGLFTGLAYFTKPGAVILGGVFLVCVLIFRKDRRKALLYGLLALLLTFVCGYALSALLSGSFSLIGLYTKQTSDWVASHALIALGSAALMSVFLAAALSGTFFLIPFLNLKEYDRDRRDTVLFTAAGTLVALLGTAVFVTPYRWSGEMLFLRYITPCMPLFIVFTLGAENAKHPLGKKYPRAMLVFALLFAAAGIYTAVSGAVSSAVHNFSAAAFIRNSRLNGKATGLILTIVLFLFALFEAFSGKDVRFAGGTKTVMTAALAVFLLFSNACGYAAGSVPLTEGVREDAQELNEMLGGTKALGVTGQRYDDIRSYWQEGYLTYPMQQVTFDQMAVSMLDTGGVYVPYVPVDQAPNIGNGLTTDTDTLVLGQTVREHLELSDAVSVKTTANGVYAIAKIVPGERWVDTMLYGLDCDRLSAGAEAMLLVYGGREGEMELKLTVKAPASGAVITVKQNGTVQEQTVNGQAVLSFPLRATDATVTSSVNVDITGYSTR